MLGHLPRLRSRFAYDNSLVISEHAENGAGKCAGVESGDAVGDGHLGIELLHRVDARHQPGLVVVGLVSTVWRIDERH